MELTVNRESLLPALNRVVGVVERRQTLPILGNLLIKTAADDQLEICGTDLEVEVRTFCAANVVQGGATTVPARKLLDICRNLMDGQEIRIRLSGERCSVVAGRGRFTLGTLPSADFPAMEEEIDGVKIQLKERDFKQIIDKTAFAMAQQDVRYYLNGLMLQLDNSGVIAVATDGHRLAKFQKEMDLAVEPGGSVQVILPNKTVLELRRQLASSSDETLTLLFGSRAFRMLRGGTILTSKLVDGRYPEYERVIPRGLEKMATMDVDSLKRALARTAILSNEKFRGVRLAFSSEALKLQAHNPEQEEAEEEIEVEYNGEPTAVGFNLVYLTDALNAVETSEIQVQFRDADSSSIWRGAGALEETYVVMPLRL